MRSLTRGARIHALVAAVLAFAFPPAGADGPGSGVVTPAALTQLDKRFQDFSSRFYSRLVRADNVPKAGTLAALEQTIDQYRGRDQPISAVAAVVGNLALVEDSVDTTPVIGICRLLFEANEWNTASRLYSKIKTHADRSIVSNVSLSLASHHFARNQWDETIAAVETLRGDLAPDDYHHALLMHGIALQHQRKHRAALAQYARIPPSSRHYAAARLNMAVANIRQDWWTDAHTIINALLADNRHGGDSMLTDRLYTVLGYSLLQQQYYRNAREAFRSVGVDGTYANRALLGIALTAAHQGDHIGALNAVSILKGKKYRDLPADEAILLVPYFHERLRQPTAAATGYAEAIAFYEGRILGIKAAVPENPAVLTGQVIAAQAGTITLKDEIIDLREKLPAFLFDNVRMLARFAPHVRRIGEPALTREYETLVEEHGRLLQATARLVLDERAEYLTHYMDQSRYGLARMQDHDAVAPK